MQPTSCSTQSFVWKTELIVKCPHGGGVVVVGDGSEITGSLFVHIIVVGDVMVVIKWCGEVRVFDLVWPGGV